MRTASHLSRQLIQHITLLCAVASCIATTNIQAEQRIAQFAQIDYDVVYVRCPRGKEPVSYNGTQDFLNWNGVNDRWLAAANNVYQQPGCDLVLHHSDMPAGDPSAEEVLVNCDEDDNSQPVCTVTDPNVSFDGRYIVYSKFTDTRSFVQNLGMKDISIVGKQSFMRLYPDGDGPGGVYAKRFIGYLKPYAAPAYVYIYDLVTKTEKKVSPDSGFFAGRAYPGKDPEWTSNIPIMDTGPFFMADGRIGFTSNRANGFSKFQLFSMNRDGSNLELVSHRGMGNQLHPIILTDGRIAYTSFDKMIQKTTNNNFSLFTVNPDGSNPFILAGKHDATMFTYHFITQLSDGDIIATLYYTHNNDAMGSLLRFPIDPAGPDFTHLRGSLNNTSPFDGSYWLWGDRLIPFARPGQFMLTPKAPAGDVQVSQYSNSTDYWTHPVDGRSVIMKGKFTHPAAAPENNLLTTYTIGGSSTMPHGAFYVSLEETMKVIGKDAGIWLLPLGANSSRQIQHIADDGRIVVDYPEYHEIMPRAVVSYQSVYGMSHPKVRETTSNQGSQDPRLPAGKPYGLTGAASLMDRETRSINGTPWNMKDGGGTMSGRTYMNLATSGAELAIFDKSEIYGVRVLMPLPGIPDDIYSGKEQWAGVQRHHMRILGEFPVRKPDGTPQDGQGNPDTSFVVRLPADTPFMFQTIDKRGMALDIETASRTVNRGEQQFCSGCHVHTREGLDPFQSLAKLDTGAPYSDFTGDSAPLFASFDSDGKPVTQPADTVYSDLPGSDTRRSFAVDWENGIDDILQNRCASCHGPGQSAQQQTGLRLDGDDRTYDLLTTNRYVREDGVTTHSNSKPGNGLTDLDAPGTDRITPRYSCCTASRWLALNSARSSMLVWALYGERLDGRDPQTGLPPADSDVPVDPDNREHPEIWPKVDEHAAYVADMPEAEKRLIARWIDLGAPKLNAHDDLMRPVLTITPVQSGDAVASVYVGLWDDSPLDYSRFKVTANGVDITPQVQGTPDMVEVTLPTAVSPANATDWSYTFEIWDQPDRGLSYAQPSVAAANRTRKTMTGEGLLRMVGALSNSAPTQTSASITTSQDMVSGGVLPSVSDPDSGDSHMFSIVDQPAKGIASVLNNRLVYTPDSGYVGEDSFVYRAADLGGLSVEGTATVTVTAAESVQEENTGSQDGDTGSVDTPKDDKQAQQDDTNDDTDSGTDKDSDDIQATIGVASMDVLVALILLFIVLSKPTRVNRCHYIRQGYSSSGYKH